MHYPTLLDEDVQRVEGSGLMGVLPKSRNAGASTFGGSYLPRCRRRLGEEEKDCGACFGRCPGLIEGVSSLRTPTDWQPCIQSEPWFMATDERFVLQSPRTQRSRYIYRRSEPSTDAEKSRDLRSRQRNDYPCWKIR